METRPDGSHPQPLRGVRVLDFTRVLAGPYCTMILADLGADVVKVEQPETGDDARHFGPFLPSGTSGYFASINRGKRSIAIDLKADEDRPMLEQLIASADVLVENFRPGTMDRFGLGSATLREKYPELIYASLSGFGHTGSETNRPAYDVIVQALSGLMSVTGEGPGKFVRVGTSIGDILTGMYGAIAILAALNDRQTTGKGSVIDIAMLDSTVAALENAICRFSVTGDVPHPLGGRHPSIAPFQTFDAADKPLVVAAGNDALWQRLCEVLDIPETATDSRFINNGKRTENHAAMEFVLSAAFHQRSRDDWLERLSAAGIPAAPIRDVAEVVGDSHLASRGMLHRMLDGDGREFVAPGSPLRMNNAVPPLSKNAPGLDGHRAEILADWTGE